MNKYHDRLFAKFVIVIFGILAVATAIGVFFNMAHLVTLFMCLFMVYLGIKELKEKS